VRAFSEAVRGLILASLRAAIGHVNPPLDPSLPTADDVSSSSRKQATIEITMAPTRRARSVIRPIGRLVSSPGRRWCIGGLAVFVLTALFLAHENLAHMGQSFLHADRRWVAVAVGLMLASLVLRSAALECIVDALGGVRARLSDSFSATSIGLLANSVIPIRVGTVLAPYTLYVLLRRRGTAVPFATALGVALTERLFAIATFAALSLLFVSTLAMPAWAVQVLVAVAAIAATFLIGGIVLERRRRKLAANGGQSRLGEAPDVAASSRLGGLWRHVPELVDSQRIMGKPWSALLVTAVQAMAWLVQLAAAWAALQAFHLGGAGLRGAALVLVLTNLIGLVPITPGNVGTFQAAAVAALAFSGVGAGPAVAYALGLQAMQLAVAVVAGLASLSLQDLSLGDLRGRSRQAASLLYGGEAVAPARAESRVQS
jgi:glycosyltransferase 2 family protein